MLLVGAGCFEAPPEAKARLEQVRADGAALDEALEDVGGRLLGGRSLVALWQELGWRHRSVTEVACQNASTHVEAMVRHVEKQETRKRKSKRRPRLQAEAEAVSSATGKQARARRN